ncbi:uncharacterized protein LOC107266905 [Cephus cinctus]|uniref:Uncharacterized protein LOC107266905 n=1 Tax=Cephus cinctus TaxID=211228 RepID=A0AAJ7RG17_CEPCN|nr:uncharacterized protein LOC107266905 [Cephus cinctus]XP_015593407.1 uncharacterized protein LOC107266905 [Cephus cinctus]XP_015593408.1 uncharacterized protein LOC107266905 [Cephus cinctus]XP_024939736.1 uncharacterized protein LOC107266905 [Cephus cinctus]
MGFINDELQEVSKLCQNVIDGSRLVCCVQSMVRVEITKTQFKKIIVCIQFPQDYPKVPLLIELKSKTLSEKLLNRLTSVCEKECENLLGKAQILPVLKFISNFIEENSLVCCYDEIASLKKLLLENDELKLKQKTSMIYLKAQQGSYYLKTKIVVPDNYPERCVGLEDTDSNFPAAIVRYILGKGKELGRQCVEPPIKEKARATLFQPSPSLNIVASFLVRSVKMLPMERCQLCRKLCLPEKPEEAVIDENADLHVERLYCGHLFHLQCLITYMKTPPFHGGKKCPSCGQRVYHDKWRLSERLAEERWAHQQARARELAEVADFFE